MINTVQKALLAALVRRGESGSDVWICNLGYPDSHPVACTYAELPEVSRAASEKLTVVAYTTNHLSFSTLSPSQGPVQFTSLARHPTGFTPPLVLSPNLPACA